MTTSTHSSDGSSDHSAFAARRTPGPDVAPAPRPPRLLRFGPGRAIGSVEIVSRRRSVHLDAQEVLARYSARFDVSVPAARSARLRVARGLVEPGRFAPFAEWPPDALDELILMDCTVGDPALRHIAGLTGLRVLDLFGTYVTDVSAPVLAGLTDLEWLSLSFTRLETSGVVALADLAHLWRLSVRGTAITDDALVALARIPSLTWLSVADTAVTSAGIEYLLARAPALRWVAINGTPAALDARTFSWHRRPGVELIHH